MNLIDVEDKLEEVSLSETDCWICRCGFIHVKWNGDMYVLGHEVGWLSGDEYRPSHHPCVVCRDSKDEICRLDSITMNYVDGFIAAGLYYGEEFGGINHLLSEWVLKLKRDQDYAAPLGCALATVINKYWNKLLRSERFIITPVPKHKDEGVNQAALLAEVVYDRLRRMGYKPVLINDLVIKKEPMKASERRKQCESGDSESNIKCNVERAYSILKLNTNRNIKNSTILVIDDVRTSGATLGAIARLLKEEGAGNVYAAVVGRNAIKQYLNKCTSPYVFEDHSKYPSRWCE